jgi:hypothetical protein
MLSTLPVQVTARSSNASNGIVAVSPGKPAWRNSSASPRRGSLVTVTRSSTCRPPPGGAERSSGVEVVAVVVSVVAVVAAVSAVSAMVLSSWPVAGSGWERNSAAAAAYAGAAVTVTSSK